ncbi:HIT family protein [Candidatus Saccharibacteria bacterium]|nr:MAG: HIT family protein [Candidatus Saccharibacteria bacterium]
MEGSIFTKIIRGDIPCHKIYEDEKTFAFLDIHPVQEGMTLVVTKTPAETVLDLGDEDYAALWSAVRVVAQRLREVYADRRRIAIQVEGLDVPHVHVKLFPIDTGEQFRSAPDMSAEPDHQQLARVAEKLRIDG